MKDKKPFVSEKLAKRRKAHAKGRRIFLVLVFLVILGTAGFFTYGERFQITNSIIAETQAVSADEIKINVDNYLNGNRGLIVPRTNIFLYPKNALSENLAKNFPRLKNINLEIKNKEIIVTTTEREPAYLWCGEVLPNTRQEAFLETCYFVDDSGFIFSLSPQFSDAVYPKIYTTLESSENPIGKHAIASNILENVSILAKNIISANYKISAYSVTSDKDVLIYLYRNSDKVPEIRYNPDHDPLKVSANFKTAINTQPLKKKLADSFAILDYIDLRFANKVFYKFNDQAVVESGNE